MSRYGELIEDTIDKKNWKKYYLDEDGEINGPYEEYSDGRTIKCNYKHGKLHGAYEHDHYGSLKCTYKNGQLHGKYINVYAHGKEGIECTYKNGVIVGQLKILLPCSIKGFKLVDDLKQVKLKTEEYDDGHVDIFTASTYEYR